MRSRTRNLSPLTISRPSRPSLTQRIAAASGIVAAATGAAIAGRRAMTASRNTSSQHGKRGASKSSEPQKTINRWSQPIQHELSFDTGDVSLMFDICDPSNGLGYGTSAVSVAMMDFLGEQEGSNRGQAQHSLHKLLLATHPDQSVLDHAASERTRTKTTGADQLTAELQYLEGEYLRFIHGMTGRRYQHKRLAKQISGVATTLGARGSQRREAGARIILADLNLRQGNPTEADHEMRVALDLIRSITPSPILGDRSSHQLGSATQS